jgi:chromosome segregation ATPase
LAPRISFFAFQDIITSTSGILIIVVLLLGTFLGSVAPEISTSLQTPPRELLEKKEMLLSQIVEMKAQLQAIQEAGKVDDPDGERLRQARERMEIEKMRLEEELRGKKITQQNREKELKGAIEASGLTPMMTELDSLEEKNQAARKEAAALESEHEALRRAVEKNEAKLAAFEAEKGKIWLQPRNQDTTKAPLILSMESEKATLYEFDWPERSQSWVLGSSQMTRDIETKLKDYSPSNHYLVIFLQPEGVSAAKEIKEKAKGLGFDVGWDALEPGTILLKGPPPVFELEEPEPLPSLPPEKT